MSGNLAKVRAVRALLAAALGLGLGASLLAAPVRAEEEITIPRLKWSFAGVLGHYDRAQLQRGLKIYKEVCSSCHGLRLVKYRNLGEPGGPELSEAEVKALAAGDEVPDGPNDEGEMYNRPARPADAFKSPFPNLQLARLANNGALPPDLSLMAKAREAGKPVPFYAEPIKWLEDMVTGYQEGGADYIHALLTGFRDEPPSYVRDAEGKYVELEEGKTDPKAEKCASIDTQVDEKTGKTTYVCVALQEGLNYNVAFPGHQIAMVKPLSEGQVEYTDGTPATLDQYSADISAFLMWTAEPKLEERKHLGIRVLLFLLVMAVLLGLAKRAMWSKLH